MKIAVEEKYTRAAPGGVGFSKNAGNYGGSMLALLFARQNGYDQVLWTDAFEHKWLQEVGMMNVFFIINGVVVTPSLDDGCILGRSYPQQCHYFTAGNGLKRLKKEKFILMNLLDAYKKGVLE
jgi:branched-chain amino acid aminotransferase